MFKQNHLTMFKQNHLTMFKQNHLTMFKQNHLTMFKQNHLTMFLQDNLMIMLAFNNKLSNLYWICPNWPPYSSTWKANLKHQLLIPWTFLVSVVICEMNDPETCEWDGPALCVLSLCPTRKSPAKFVHEWGLTWIKL